MYNSRSELAVPVASGGEIDTASAFSFRPVALGAVAEKILVARRDIGRRAKRVSFWKILVRIRRVLPFLRHRYTDAGENAENHSDRPRQTGKRTAERH